MINKILATSLVLLLSACATSSATKINQDPDHDRVKFEALSIGDPLEKVKESFGEPVELSEEKYQDSVFKVFEYLSQGQPKFSFSIDEGSRVAGKTIWPDSKSDSANLSRVLDKQFKGIKFIRKTPCRTWGNDFTLFNEKLGLFLSVHDEQVIAYSWGSDRLTHLREAEFSIKCPTLQKPQEEK